MYRLNFGNEEEKLREVVFVMTDHLGKQYAGLYEMCYAYNITVQTFYNRMHMGYELEDILTMPVSGNMKCTDHLGNTYNSIKDMCNAYNRIVPTFTDRLKRGWSLKDALEIEPMLDSKGNPKACRDHLGNQYNSLSEMCKQYNISINTFHSRKRRGWSLERILTTEIKQKIRYRDHLGNEYDSERSMCKAYGINVQTYRHRLKLGKTIEEALTGKLLHKNNRKVAQLV